MMPREDQKLLPHADSCSTFIGKPLLSKKFKDFAVSLLGEEVSCPPTHKTCSFFIQIFFLVYQILVCNYLLKHQIEIARVKRLNSQKAVFSATSVALAIGMECQTVDRSEMSF